VFYSEDTMIYLNYLLEATHGVLRIQGEKTQYAGFSHDTRQIIPGEMFVAVRGVRGNGHDYLLDALRRGATGLLVEIRAINALPEQTRASIAQARKTVVEVEDTRQALQDYTRTILALWKPTVIAVAGSVGKTSTKEAIATVLATRYPTFRSWQNYNDRLGIPLSLGRLNEQDQFAVLELGCDHPGEISDLCSLVQPQIGVLTNIQPVQLQYFGSLDRLAKELSTLLDNLPNGGHFFYNQDDELLLAQVNEYKKNQLQQQSRASNIHLHTFAKAEHKAGIQGTASPLPGGAGEQTGQAQSLRPPISSPSSAGGGLAWALPMQKDDEYPALGTARIIDAGWEGIRAILTDTTDPAQTAQEQLLASPLLGEHHLATMLATYQVARTLGMSAQEITQALKTLNPLPGRLNPLPGIHNARLLDDTHNASPAAVMAGLKTLNRLTPTGGRRIAVLGDMTHLGEYTKTAHRAVGRYAASLVDYLVIRGEQATMIAEAAQQAGLPSTHIILTANYEDAAQAVRKILVGTADRGVGSGQALTGPNGPCPPSASENFVSLNASSYKANNSDLPPFDVVLIKGSEETRMERVTELLMARSWEASEKLVRQTPGWKKTTFRHAERPTWVEIDLNAIASNTRHIKSLVGPKVQILVALKADAYGHGAIKTAHTVLHNGANMLGVATLSEVVPLREAGITAPILVFGYMPLWQMREAIRLETTVTLYSQESAQELSQAAQDLGKKVKVHLKVDTGMARLGVRYEQEEEIVALARMINTLPGLAFEGAYTHFAQADTTDRTYSHWQLTRFQYIIEQLEKLELRPPIVHAANSAAILSMPKAHYDMVRPGVAIYGLHPSPDVTLPENFRPALSFKTQVSQVKWLPAGEGISYGSTYITSQPIQVATLPVGYADGFRRAPRNWGSVLVHGQEAPILGRVCMDQCMIDVTHIPHVRSGDEVVLIGYQGDATLSAEEVAARLGTINYEVVSEILARVPRVD
jgi:alanine racemase